MTEFREQGVRLVKTVFSGRPALQVTMPSSANQDPTKEALVDRDFMAITEANFGNGVISVDVASTLAADAPAYARGFIGIAFRIDAGNHFESIYLRPVNSRIDDQLRRNRSVQYVSYPDHTFPRLREEAPGQYETYADVPMDSWINMRIEVHGERAALFLGGADLPCFVVTDLKLGASQRGAVGLWIEAGTVGYFSNLSITG